MVAERVASFDEAAFVRAYEEWFAWWTRDCTEAERAAEMTRLADGYAALKDPSGATV